MQIRVINTPSKGTLRILTKKVTDASMREYLAKERISAVGLIQGQVSEIIVAADIAEKAADVEVAEISGSCPQHFTVLGIFGETSAVDTALEAINKWDKLENKVKK